MKAFWRIMCFKNRTALGKRKFFYSYRQAEQCQTVKNDEVNRLQISNHPDTTVLTLKQLDNFPKSQKHLFKQLKSSVTNDKHLVHNSTENKNSLVTKYAFNTQQHSRRRVHRSKANYTHTTRIMPKYAN